MMSFD